MSLSLSAMRELVACGLTAEQILRVAEAQGDATKPRSSAAERQARYRARQEERNPEDDVTRDVTCDASQSVTAPLPLPSSPQTPQLPTPTPGNIITRARKGAAKVDQVRGWLEFWQAYPRKVSKDAAAKAFAKALARIAEPDPVATILSGLERAKAAWVGKDPDFIPHAATWLNGGRWADEEHPAEQRSRNDQQPASTPRRDAKLAGFQRAVAASGVTDFAGSGWD